MEALIWLQDILPPPAPPAQVLITPGQLLKCMTTGGGAALNVVRVLYADPWTEGSCSALITSLSRSLRCRMMDSSRTVENDRAGAWALDLAAAACAACPSRVSREAMSVLLSLAPG